MPEPALVSVQEAADRLGLSAMTVRHHVASGRLPAIKRGGAWWIDVRAVERMRREPRDLGRPLSAEMAWAVILLDSGDADGAAVVAGRDRYLSRARAWIRDHPLDRHASRLRGRAQAERFDAHASELARVADREDVLRTGVCALEEAGLVGSADSVEVYAPSGHRDSIVAAHALDQGAGAVRIRWVRDDLWSHIVAAGVAGRAPRTAVLLDLLDDDDPRARREALARLRP